MVINNWFVGNHKHYFGYVSSKFNKCYLKQNNLTFLGGGVVKKVDKEIEVKLKN